MSDPDDIIIREPIIVDIEDVAMKPVKWFWRDRFQSEAVNMISGNQEVGKSTFTLYMAAMVLAGGKWPYLPDDDVPTGSIIFLSTEDNIAQVIKPKMMALRQSLPPLPGNRMVTIIGIKETSTKTGKVSGKWLENLTSDLDILQQTIQKIGNVVLIIIDPITDYAGMYKENKNADIRAYLHELKKFAEGQKLAIIGLSHLNKDSQKAAGHRTLGSVAWTAYPRAAWLLEFDPADPERRCLMKQKCNEAVKPLNIAFRLRGVMVRMDDGKDYSYPVCDFEAKPISMTADEALNPDTRRMKQTKIAEAKEWLQEFLASGPRLSKEVFACLKQDTKVDITLVTLKRAMTILVKDDVTDATDIRNDKGYILETKWALLS